MNKKELDQIKEQLTNIEATVKENNKYLKVIIEQNERIKKLEDIVDKIRFAKGDRAISFSEKIKFLIISLIITAIVSQGIKEIQDVYLYMHDDRRGRLISEEI